MRAGRRIMCGGLAKLAVAAFVAASAAVWQAPPVDASSVASAVASSADGGRGTGDGAVGDVAAGAPKPMIDTAAPFASGEIVEFSGGNTIETDNMDGTQEFSKAPDWYVPNWDTYIPASDGPLKLHLTLPYRGPVDGDGHPVPGHIYYGDTVTLIVHAWDVDDNCGTHMACEVDHVEVNGDQIVGQLHGDNGSWSYTSFDVPVGLFHFTASPGTNPGHIGDNYMMDLHRR